MSWRRRSTSTSIDVDLDEFETDELLQELINRNIIDEASASALSARDGTRFAPRLSEIQIATDEIRCGRRQEALVHLERALGRDWLGVLA